VPKQRLPTARAIGLRFSSGLCRIGFVVTGTVSSGSRTIQGWAAGTPADSEDTLRVVELTGVRPMVETYLLEKAAEAYEGMTAASHSSVRFLTM
jgi:D-arabinose 1-dehydrogenase-like Zn-dependent alcohol dehydrogenase